MACVFLAVAKFCINCDTIFDEALCPVCSSKNYWLLATWLNRSETQPQHQETT